MYGRYKTHENNAVYLRRDLQRTIIGLTDKNDILFVEHSCDACLSRCSQVGSRQNPTNWTYESLTQPQNILKVMLLQLKCKLNTVWERRKLH